MAIDGAFGIGNLTNGSTVGIAQIEIDPPVTYANGGTNATSAAGARHNLLSFGLSGSTTGDIWYRNTPTTVTRLPIGAESYVLTVASGIPAWRASTGGPGPGDGSGGIGEVPSTPPGYWVRTSGNWTQTIDDGVY